METIDEEPILRSIKSEISADTTSQVAVCPLSSVVIVIVEVPSFNAVTFPLLSTETMLYLLWNPEIILRWSNLCTVTGIN